MLPAAGLFMLDTKSPTDARGARDRCARRCSCPAAVPARQLDKSEVRISRSAFAPGSWMGLQRETQLASPTIPASAQTTPELPRMMAVELFLV